MLVIKNVKNLTNQEKQNIINVKCNCKKCPNRNLSGYCQPKFMWCNKAIMAEFVE